MDELVLLLGHPLMMHAVEVALLPELVPGCRRLHACMNRLRTAVESALSSIRV